MHPHPCARVGIVSNLRTRSLLKRLIITSLIPGLAFTGNPLYANPRGGSIVHGDVNIGAGNGGNLQIRQNSNSAIINWESFSIDAGELTQFRQPNRNAAVLNRVTGGDPSAIHGALKANGNVFVINPNGILVGPGGTIDVHGLVLSTLDVENGEFLAGGDLTFKGVGENVTNMGRINGIGGDVFLIGRTVRNSGTITASSGTVGLAAGEEVLLTAQGNTGERLFVRAKGAGVSGTGILNDGTIEGAAVELKAHGNMFALAINNKGSIRATGAVNSGGRVYLRGAGGSVNNSGSIRATGPGAGSGGRVLIEAAYAKVDGMMRAERGNVRITGTEKVELGGTIDVSTSSGRGGDVVVEGADIKLSATNLIDASGDGGGGNVQIGGGFQGSNADIINADLLTVEAGSVIIADATASGSGGNVILWSDGDTMFEGSVSARGISRGGFAEVSGKQNLGFDGAVDLTAANGPAGTLLLDPTNVTIGTAATGPSHINNIALSNTLDLGNNVIIATNFGGAGPRGDITIQAGVAGSIGANAGGIEWYQESAGTVGGTLSLLATGNILFANDVRSAGAGGINIVAGWDGSTGIVDPLSGAAQTSPGVFNMAAVLATMNDGNSLNDAAGLNAGSVFINGYTIDGAVTNTSEGIEVGSRYGATQVAAHDLLIRGSNGGQRWAQLGFRDSGAEFGLNGTVSIGTQNGERNEWWGSNGAANGSGGATQYGNIQNKDYIALLGGTVESGGAFRGAGYGATGDIIVNVGGRIDIRGGDGGNAAAQIGHGGLSAEGVEPNRNVGGLPAGPVTTRDGAIIDVNDNNRAFFGATWRTNYAGDAARVDGDISIKAGEDILAMAPSTFESNAGYEDLTNNDGNGSRYVKIGHGGFDNFGSYHGDISVIALGATTTGDNRGLAGAGIQLRAGMGSLNIAQIGHGGFHEGNHRTIWDQTSSGNVTVRAETGAVRALGFNLMPRIGDQNSGSYVGVDTILPVNSGSDTEYEFSNVQIGHGGWHRSRVTTGSFTPPGGAANTTTVPNQSMTGDVTVYAGGTVQVRDNMGYDSAGNWTADPGPGVDPILLSGGILRDVGIEVRAGNNSFAYGMIGHGGVNINSNSTGSLQGDVTVTAAKGTILFVGGEEKRSARDWGLAGSFVQVGHGGYDSDAMAVGNGFRGALTVSAGQGGFNDLGQAIVPLDGDIIFRTGRMGESWAQIGLGGRSSNGDIVGDGTSPITVTARDTIEFTGRLSGPSNPILLSTDYYNVNVMNPSGIGGDGNAHTGQAGGNVIDADTRPQANTRGLSYNVDIKHAQIGHGGYDFLVDNQPTRNFSLNNHINVVSQTGAIRFTASDADNDFIMIGTGGIDFAQQRNITGSNVTVTSFSDIIFDASAAGVMEWNRTPIGGANGLENREFSKGIRGFAMIGNGGYDVDGDFTGDVTVTAGRHLHMVASPTAQLNTVTGYVGNTVSGPAAVTGTTLMPIVGTDHVYTALQEATMKQRSFTLYHGANGAAPTDFKGAIVPGTVRIDTNVDPDLGDYNGDGNLRRTAGGPILGTVDYATGVVTILERVQTDDNAINRNVDYSYTLPSSSVQNIQDERTPESDSALFASQAYLGNGGIVPGSVSLVIDANNDGGGRRVIADPFFNGVLYNEQNLRVGSIDYNTGRIIIEGVNTATGDGNGNGGWEQGTPIEQRAPLNSRTSPDEVVANYQYTTGNRDQSFVQIGNGGYSANLGGRNTPGHSGEIRVTAANDIRIHGGAFDDNSVQIGHGGRSSQGWHGYQTAQADRANPDFAAIDADGKGNITVQAGGIFEVLAGRGIGSGDNEQFAQVGHGGYDADGNHQGNIRVTSGQGNISSWNGLLGDTSETGGVVFTAGRLREAYVQLGHGGFGARSSRADGDAGAEGLYGSISLTTGGDVRFTAGTSLANLRDYDDARIYAQLGHGGYDADIRNDGGTQLRNTGIGHAGDISVISQNGSIIFQAGDETKAAPGGAILGEGFGIIHYTHLGHGGYSTQGDHHGNITVTARNSVQFYGGSFTQDDSTDKRNYAILGHGGDESEGYNGARDANNNPLDTIAVTATTGDVEFIAGSGRRNWAQLGNGGLSNNGDHVANINVTAGGNVHFLGGQGNGDMWINGEKRIELDVASRSSVAGTNLPGGWAPLRYKDVRLVTTSGSFTITVNGFAYRATGATLQEADDPGDFTAANIVAAADVDYDGDTNVDIAAGTVVGEIDLRTGHVRFFVDIDPTDTNAFVAQYTQASTGAFNNAAENQTTNPVLAQAIQGVNNFAASSTNLQSTFSNTRNGITNVADGGGSNHDDNVGIEAGTFRLNVPDGTVVQDDGNGGLFVTTVGAGSNLTPGQQVGSVSYLQGQIVLTSVINPNGHSGVAATYKLDRAPGSDLSYAQLGNGGYDADDVSAGTVQNEDKSNVGDITVISGGNVRFHGGNGNNAYSQMGNGGYETKGAHSGNIVVNAGGALEFLGGIGRDETDTRAYAMLGHGGHEGDGNHYGDITITSGTGLASSGPGLVNIGASTSEIGILFKAGDREDSSVRMGHGGTNARSGTATTPFGLNGDIVVTSAGSVSFVGGTGTLNADGDITGNSDFRLSAQMGHGGYDADAADSGETIQFFNRRGGTGIAGTEGGGDGHWGHFGDITVDAGGSISFVSGDQTRLDPILKSVGQGYGQYSFSQLGHGGYQASGDHHGNITVRAGIGADRTINNADADVLFAAGGPSSSEWADIRSYSQLGHGGYNGSAAELGRAGQVITVMAARDVIAQGGTSVNSYAQIGNGGFFSDRNAANLASPVGVDVLRGDIDIYAGRDVKVLAGEYLDNVTAGQGLKGAYTWTGTDSNGVTRNPDLAGNLGGTNPGGFNLQFSRIVPGSIMLEIRLDNNLLVGNLVQDGNNIVVLNDFSVDVTGDGIAETFTAGEVVGSYSPLLNRVTFTRDVNPGADGGDANIRIFFEHLNMDRAYAQIGHGGYDSDYTPAGLTGPQAATARRTFDDIIINSGGDLVLRGGDGSGNYSQVGHGGQATAGLKEGNILIGSAGDRLGGAVIMEGGHGGLYDAADAYVQIGHGGRSSTGTALGDISVFASEARDAAYAGMGALVKAGTRNNSYALVGHGGTGSRSGTNNDAAGMEGNSGDVTVDAIGDINVVAGVLNTGGGTLAQSNDDGNLFAQIGHGGYDSDVSLNGVIANGNGIGHNGAIRVISRQGSVNVLGGDHLRSFLPSFAPISGSLDVLPGRLGAEAGGRFHYAMIGHGGYEARGNHWGDITVHAGFDETGAATGGSGDVLIRGGIALQDQDVSQQFAQIGHGGRSSVGDQGRVTDTTSVMAGGDVTLQGGDGVDNYAMVGNGGTNGRGDHGGDINVFAVGNVNVLASQMTAATALGSGTPGGYTLAGTSDTESIDRAANLQAGGDFTIRAGINRVIAGSVYFDVYNDGGIRIGTVADADGSGNLLVVSDFTELVGATQYTAGQQVGTVNYAGGASPVITFTSDINPGADDGVPNLVLRYENAQSDRAFAMIGHGGYDADNPDGNTALGGRGNIAVTARDGDITLRGGFDDDTSATIGHGGRSTMGAASGNIRLTAGGGLDLIAGDFVRAYASVGHGGYDADGSHTGDICIHVGENVLLDSTLGTAQQTYTQIGHGQYASAGNQTGFITVVSGLSGMNGGIELRGGLSGVTEQYSQIGHGGLGAGGNHSGDITLIDSADADLTLRGGGAANSYALVGHGDAAGTGGIATTAGTRTGSLFIQTGGQVNLVNGTVPSSAAALGHRSTVANQGMIAGGGQTTLIAGSIDYTNFNLGAFISQGAFAGNTTVVTTAVDLVISSAINVNAGFGINLLSTGDVTMLAGLQNAGSGAVNIGAGWDETTGLAVVDFNSCTPVTGVHFDFAQVRADIDAWGNNGGAVQIGDGTQTTGVAVGSAGGSTGVLGYGITLNGSTTTNNGYAQVGFRSAPGVSTLGGIDLASKDDGISLTGGANQGTYAQVGHGGSGSAPGTLSGAISMTSTVPFDLILNGGSGATSYAQVGHGGFGFAGNQSSTIDLSGLRDVTVAGGSGSNAYAQIGLGGVGSSGTKSADLSLVADTITITGGSGATASAQIGSGGRIGTGDITGNVSVECIVGDVVVAGGEGGFASAQIGHGGANYNGSVVDQAVNVVSAAGLELTGGSGVQASAQIGHGGGSATGTTLSGATTVTVADGISVLSGTGGASYSQIGHGGFSANAAMGGAIVVTAGTEIDIASQALTDASYAKIGHGDDLRAGFAAFSGTGDRSGDIVVSTGGNVSLTGGMVGHVNSLSGATALAGVTQIGVSRDNPADPAGGSLIADASSQFHGEDELRFYLPRRGNNQIAAGAILNGAVWSGAPTDPSPVQRIDEFTINIISDPSSTPNEHTNVIGSGPAPANAAGFAFYYDTILLGPAPFVPGPPKDPSDPSDPGFPGTLPPLVTDPDLASLLPDDRTTDEWQRDHEDAYSGPGEVNIYYEGFGQYGFFGESIFELNDSGLID